MIPRTVLLASLLIPWTGLAGDPDAFPVESVPTIDEASADGRQKNRAGTEPDEPDPGLGGLKNRAEPPPGAAPEVTAAAESEVNPAPTSASPTANPPDDQAPAASPAGEPPPPAEPPAPPSEDAARERRTVWIWMQDTSEEVGSKLSDAWDSVTSRKRRDGEDTDEVEDEPQEEDEPEVEPPDPEPAEPRPLAIPAHRPPPAPAPRVEDHDIEVPRARRWRFTQQTLVGLRKRSGRFGVYAAGTGLSSGFGTGPTTAGGLEAGVILGGHVVLGGAAYGSSEFALDSGRVSQFTWGGLNVGYIIAPSWLVHPRIDALIGSGVLVEAGSGRPIAQAAVFSPRVGLEMNVTRGVRLMGHAGVRRVSAPSEAGRDLSAPEVGLTLQVGWL